jgi:hypothetical protein
VRLSHNFIFKKEMGDAFVEEIIDKLERKLYNDSPLYLATAMVCCCSPAARPTNNFTCCMTCWKIAANRSVVMKKKFSARSWRTTAIRQINSGHEQFYEMLYPLLENRLMEAEEISSSEVKTFITLCLRMEKPAVAHRFIQEKKAAIVPADIREDAFNYSMALLHFYQKNYSDVSGNVAAG